MLTHYQTRIEHRDRLYYDKYQYSFGFQQQELYCLRGLPANNKQIDRYVKNREYYDLLRIERSDNQFTTQVVSNLCQTRDVLRNDNIPVKLVVSGKYGNLYTNNLEIIDSLCQLDHVKIGVLKVATVSIPRDTVMIQNPKHQYRTYFRECKVSSEIKQTLSAWIEACQGEVMLSKATQIWLYNIGSTWRRSYSQRYYYVEHNNLQYETMMRLVAPGIVRKTVPVIGSDK